MFSIVCLAIPRFRQVIERGSDNRTEIGTCRLDLCGHVFIIIIANQSGSDHMNDGVEQDAQFGFSKTVAARFAAPSVESMVQISAHTRE